MSPYVIQLESSPFCGDNVMSAGFTEHLSNFVFPFLSSRLAGLTSAGCPPVCVFSQSHGFAVHGKFSFLCHLSKKTPSFLAVA